MHAWKDDTAAFLCTFSMCDLGDLDVEGRLVVREGIKEHEIEGNVGSLLSSGMI